MYYLHEIYPYNIVLGSNPILNPSQNPILNMAASSTTVTSSTPPPRNWNFLKNWFNRFLANVSILYPLKKKCLKFSGK